MTERLIIVRHGETDWNAQGKLNSFTDIPLNEVGRNQAREAGAALRHVGIEEIFISPATRARQTTDEILSVCGTTDGFESPVIKVDERLRELNFGPFEGLTQREIKTAGLSEQFSDWRTETSQRSPDGAESFSTAQERASSLMSDVLALTNRVVLFVSHGHFSRILLAHCVLGTTAEYHRRLRFDNGRLADILIEEDKPRLIAFNTLEVAPFR